MSENHVWVEIEVNKGIGALNTYRGHVSRHALDRWCAGGAEGAFAIEDTYWWTRDPQWEGGGFYTVMGHSPGSVYSNATGRVLLRFDLVVTIIELVGGDEYEQALRRVSGASAPSSH